MREIKFRAWDKSENRFLKSWVFNQLLKQTQTPDSTELTIDIPDWIVLLQSTGLHDKNGKEIFEGDILRWWVKSTNSFADELLVVKWGSVGWVLKSPLFKSFGVLPENAECNEINTIGYLVSSEILGNIHENPELLK